MEKLPRRMYTKEFKEEAAQLVVNGGMGLTEAARRLSISVKTLANWVAAAKHGKPVKAGTARRLVTELEAENSQLKRALAEMKDGARSVKKSDGVLREGIAVRYALMKQLKGQFPVSLMSHVFEVCKSGYYAWLKRAPSQRAQNNARLEVAIKAAHVRSRESYGPERLQKELSADGFHAGVGRIKRLRKQLGIRCKHLNMDVLMSRRPWMAESDEAQVQSDHALQSHLAGGREPAEAGV